MYLLYFAHEHLNFKWIEFTALASKHGCEYDLVTKREEFEENPYILIRTSNVNHLLNMVRDSFLIKGLYELWGYGKTLDELSNHVMNCPNFQDYKTNFGHQSFRVNVESFLIKLTQPTKIIYIEAMKFLNEFSSRPNLKNPQQVYNIFVHKYNGYFFGRLLNEGNRDLIHKLNLKERIFIANTSMDPQLSLICANAAKVKTNDLVYDPFVGSGSLLIGAAQLGAYVMGGDIDWALLHGRSKPSRKSDRIRQQGESIRANFIQYNILDKYIDVTVSEISKPPLVDRVRFDAIISDPPYGIREGCEKIGLQREITKLVDESFVSYPSKKTCDIKDLLADLILLSTKHLVLGGRLVYFLPIPNNRPTESLIPRHPCLELIGYSNQPLTYRTSRSMIVMQKTREPQHQDRLTVPDTNDATKFRELYFSTYKDKKLTNKCAE